MTENEKQIEKNTNDPNPKTPYSPPQLMVYGDIREITLASKKGEKSDNAKDGYKLKTGFSEPTPTPNPRRTYEQ